MINAEFVEKALLGAILNEPTRREEVPWLEVDDFTNPLCRALWQHLEAGAAPDVTPPVDYVALSDAIRKPSDLHPRLTAPSQIAELQIQAPVRPDPAAYGQIIVEVAIRNQLTVLGLKIGETARQTAQPNHVQLFAAIEAIAHVQRRWERTHPAPSDPSAGEAQGNRDFRATHPLDREHYALQAEPPRDLAIVETAVVNAAVNDCPKGSRSLLLARLRPGDFSQPRIASTFQAVEDLASTGRHVDEITVGWELTRGLKDQGPGLNMTELRRNALVGQLEPGDIQTIKNVSMQRSLAMAGKELARAAENLRTDLPLASERASRFLGRATDVNLLQA